MTLEVKDMGWVPRATAELPCKRRRAGLTAWQTPQSRLPEIGTSKISCCFGNVFLRFLSMKCKNQMKMFAGCPGQCDSSVSRSASDTEMLPGRDFI